MKKTLFLLFAAAFLFAGQATAQQRPRPNANFPKWEGVADTPQMGWSSWNCFMTEIDEDLIKATADAMVNLGLVDAGYVYLNLDDGWHGERDENGFVHEDPVKFPSGMKALADYLHARGLKLGIYSDAGNFTCACYTGSLGHEYQDAITYAHWGVDYLKYDWCFTNDVNPKGAYTLMRNALGRAGRPIFFSICEWGSNKPWEWAQDVGHSWRTTGDIGPAFLPVETTYDENGRRKWKPQSVLEIIDRNEPLRQYAGPGHWNDPDMLEVGNSSTVDGVYYDMTDSEDRAHFTIWCMMAAPLILGNDLTKITPETLAIIKNKEMIAVDQDPLGVQGLRTKNKDGLQYWFKPLVDGAWAFCVMNTSPEDVTLTLDWEDLEVNDSLSKRKTAFSSTTYSAKDIWHPEAKPVLTRVKGKGRARGRLVSNPLTVTVNSHDVVAYRLTPVE
ncbi:MAG: glycoside hydrolase family 27 protein [Bacteroidales bacterium]|nr:glycoside hydrolase family 27 protein [Bacteroidales bacterium]